ncbi:MAG: acyl-CoA acyltransferase [Rhodomicrobium sp.]
MTAFPRGHRVRCRLIGEPDIDRIADLLHVGFPKRSRDAWRAALEKLARRPAPEHFPRYGYMLESENSTAGVLLTIFAQVENGQEVFHQGNISSWYVDPAFRSYAPLLTAQAQKHPDVTYINTSPSVHTWPLIEAQGFTRFADGIFVAATALTAFRAADAVALLRRTKSLFNRIALPENRSNFSARCLGKAKAYAFEDIRENALPEAEYRMLRDHHEYGCLCFWCETEDGAVPFIFRRRVVAARLVPCAHLIYSRTIEDLSRFSGAISRFLLTKGIPVLTIGANGPLAGFAGRYFPNRRPMYYRGSHKPRVGDLTYTEWALFGM